MKQRHFNTSTLLIATVLFASVLAGVFNSCDSPTNKDSQEVTVQQLPPPTPNPTPTPTPTPGVFLDEWATLNSTNPPSARAEHSAVWTGTKILIWGGIDATGAKGDGAALDPLTGIWTALSSTGAPSARYGHTAIWVGDRMLIWGGTNGVLYFNDGALYDPITNTWSSITNAYPLAARANHSSVYTGSNMLTWGGTSSTMPSGHIDGGYYTPNFGWLTLTGSAPILARIGHSSVWTGNRMIMFGGINNGVTSQDGFILDPVANVFNQLPISTNTPGNRYDHSAIWSGSKMVIWGGALSGITVSYMNDGRIFDPGTNLWTTRATSGAPIARSGHSAVWAGDAMIIWGGTNGTTYFNDGAVYH